MKLKDGSILTPDQIQILNANGPYSMAVWKSGEVSVGNEEGLSGRSVYFLEKIRKSILKNYSHSEIQNFSILDIGCNDGWVLHQLSDLPFKKMVGIEPREKNIRKGELVRQILKLENRVDYRVGDIESLRGEKYDIVLCCGVLYHVESIPMALKNIRNICSKMVFLESRCLSSDHITEKLKTEIEMRDLVYQFEEKICGLTAQKYESSYHDGSAAKTTIVNIPSTESLVMNLKILGFDEIETVATPTEYRADVWKDKRPLGGVCLTAKVFKKESNFQDLESEWISSYEKALEKTVLPRNFIEKLYHYFTLKQNTILSGDLINIKNYILSSEKEALDLQIDWLPEVCRDNISIEIIKNFRYRPDQKIALEYGKLLKKEGAFEEAMNVLLTITQALNADWRAVYRANHLMFLISKDQGMIDQSNKYKTLTLQGNPKYPF